MLDLPLSKWYDFFQSKNIRENPADLSSRNKERTLWRIMQN